MNTRNSRIALSAAGLLAITGLAATTLAQSTTERRETPYGQQDAQDQRSRGLTAQEAAAVWQLRKGSDLMGMEVKDGTGEDIATIEDLIFERGTGRITHAVLSAGGVLGLGAKEFAVPFSRLQYMAGAPEDALGDDDAYFVTDVTRADIEQAPEFDAENWTNLDHTDWWQETKSWFGDEEARRERGADQEWDADADWDWENWDEEDPYAQRIRESERQELRGTVQSIDRSGDRGNTVLTIATDEGDTKTVVVGPSWYVMSQDMMPYRNEQVTLEVCPIEGGEADFVACKSKDPSKSWEVRDDQGKPYWRTSQHMGAATKSPERLMLMSDLVGADATMPTREETGEIQDVVVEVTSGQIALAALDPNENFLGMGDDLKAVPWPAVRVVDSETVRIDATEQMLTETEDLPDELTILASPAQLEPVYRVYEVEVMPMRPRDRTASVDQRAKIGEGYAKDRQGVIAKLCEGEDVTISGRVTDVSTRTVDGFTSPMMVATLDTDEGSQTIVLGSESYFNENPLMLSIGDEVHVEAKRAHVNGREIVAATTLDANGQETALWSGDEPIWDDR